MQTKKPEVVKFVQNPDGAKFNLFQTFVCWLNEYGVGGSISRKDITFFLNIIDASMEADFYKKQEALKRKNPMLDNPIMNQKYHNFSISTLDNYRNYLEKAGYLSKVDEMYKDRTSNTGELLVKTKLGAYKLLAKIPDVTLPDIKKFAYKKWTPGNKLQYLKYNGKIEFTLKTKTYQIISGWFNSETKMIKTLTKDDTLDTLYKVDDVFSFIENKI